MTQGPRDQRGLQELDALQRSLVPPASQAGRGNDGLTMPDVILAGGLADEVSDLALRELRREGAPPAVGSRADAASIAHVVLEHQGENHRDSTITVDSIAVRADSGPSGGEPPPDGVTEALLAPEVARYCRAYEIPVSAGPVHRSLSLDDFVTYTLEVMRRRADAEIALLNRAVVKRTPFPMTGLITSGQLHSALPYRAVIGVARMTGASVASLLAPALDNPKAAMVGLAKDGGHLQVNGRPLDKARSYRIATIAFVASGGDAIVPPEALPWRPLKGSPDLLDAVETFLRTATAREDHDPSVDPQTDFGPLPSDRLLLVGLMDGGLDIANTRIANGPGYGDAQLARGAQQVWKAEWTGILQARYPRHESDSRLNMKYGWMSSQPVGAPRSSEETTDLITFASMYSYRGLRSNPALVRRYIPDPYARVGLESEFTRPPISSTQTRTFHHLELTTTAGLLFSLTPALKIRGGGGVRKELLTSQEPFGRWRPLAEAGVTLLPTALATFGSLAVKLEGQTDYSFADPFGDREHQLRASGKLSVPLLPLLFVTVGLDVFAVQRQQQGWAASYDTTVGLRVHLDAAHQSL
jgi:hypothetical protein